MKFASLFTGLGGADIGAMQAGLTPIWGIEINPDIADLAQSNFPDCKIREGDVGQFNYSELERPDWLHASPPCINASRAKNGKETEQDIYLAKGICQAIAGMKPGYFSLENVDGYLKYHSFALIKATLIGKKYNVDYQIIDCARHGIPQNRKRLFLIAAKRESFRGFPVIKTFPVVSWKEAIADLIPTLKPTTLTGWQKEAIAKKFNVTGAIHSTLLNYLGDFVIQRSGARQKDGVPNNTIRKCEPMFTIKAMSGTQRPSVKQATIVISGQPYEADTRCLARWQTIPDSYQFSGDLILDTKVIGNAVPPLMFQKIITSTLKA